MEKILKTSQSKYFFGKSVYKYIYIYFLKKKYKIFFFTDTNSKLFCIPYIKKYIPYFSIFEVIVLVPGENSKKIDNSLYIWKKLIYKKYDINTIIINLGGGVITDIGGFTASIFKRGIKFIHIPTTILGMVDASIGGKTGINLNQFKNQIGLFSHPKIILIDKFYFYSTNIKDVKYGIIEMVKHGITIDYTYWNKVRLYLYHIMKINFEKKIKMFNFFLLDKLIYQSVIIKINIVEKDTNEKGLRRILNCGHSIGHGIESYFIDKYPYMIHGKAIVLGLILESWISYKINVLSKDQFEEIFIVLSKNYNIYYDLSYYIIKFVKLDKKNYYRKINFSLIKKIGDIFANYIVKIINIQKQIKIC